MRTPSSPRLPQCSRHSLPHSYQPPPQLTAPDSLFGFYCSEDFVRHPPFTFFFLNDPATTEISPLPLPDALPFLRVGRGRAGDGPLVRRGADERGDLCGHGLAEGDPGRCRVGPAADAERAPLAEDALDVGLGEIGRAHV